MSLAGDLDLVVGDDAGLLNYIENTGTSTAPAFVQRTGGANPFEGFDVGASCSNCETYYREINNPALADLDNDGDLDLIVGGGYFENTGTSTAPEFVQRIGSDNPFDGIGSGALADLDGDGDLDLVRGSWSDSSKLYFENVGSARVPRFMQRVEDANPLNGITGMGFTAVDLDGDGTLNCVHR